MTATPPQPPGEGSAPPEVSVVIPALDAAGTLPLQLEALARQRTRRTYEVLVADNGSRDGTADVVRGFAGSPVASPRIVACRAGRNVDDREHSAL